MKIEFRIPYGAFPAFNRRVSQYMFDGNEPVLTRHKTTGRNTETEFMYLGFESDREEDIYTVYNMLPQGAEVAYAE